MVSMETIRRNIEVRPTLEIKARTPFNVFFACSQDPYVDQRTVASQPVRGSSNAYRLRRPWRELL